MIRKETLLPFGPSWARPTSDEIKEMLLVGELNYFEAAELVGIKKVSTFKTWCTQGNVPYAVWALLANHAGYGCIWKEDNQKATFWTQISGGLW